MLVSFPFPSLTPPRSLQRGPRSWRPQFTKGEGGMAVLEMIPVIVVVMVMLRYSYGYFGVIHSATVQSIAVRNYTFESFRHRSRLTYLREGSQTKYKDLVRIHGVQGEGAGTDNAYWIVGRRNIAFAPNPENAVGSDNFQQRMNEQRNVIAGKRFSEGDGVSDVWLAIRYGICIDYVGCL